MMFRPFPYIHSGGLAKAVLSPFMSMSAALRIINVVLLVPILHSISTGLWIPEEPPLISDVLMPSIGVWWFQWLTLRLVSSAERHHVESGSSTRFGTTRVVGAAWYLFEPLLFLGIESTRTSCSALSSTQRRALYVLAAASFVGMLGLGSHEYLSNRCRLSLGEGIFRNGSLIEPETKAPSIQERLITEAQLAEMGDPNGPLTVILTDDQIRRVLPPGKEIFVPLLLPARIQQWLLHEKGDTDNERLREFIETADYGQSRAAILAVTLSSDRWRVLHSQMWFVISIGAVMSSIGAAVACARAFLLASAERRISMSNAGRDESTKAGDVEAARARREIVVSVAITLVLVALNMGLYVRQAKEMLAVIWLPPHIRSLAIVLATAVGMVVFQIFFGVFHIATHVGKTKRQLLILFFALSAAVLILVHGMMVAKCVIPLTPGADAIPVPKSATYSKEYMHEFAETRSDRAVDHHINHETLKSEPDEQRSIYVPLYWVGKMKERLDRHNSDSAFARAEEVRHDENWFDESAPNQYPWQYSQTSILFGVMFAGISACLVAVIALTGELFLEAQNPLINAILQWLGVYMEKHVEPARESSAAAKHE